MQALSPPNQLALQQTNRSSAGQSRQQASIQLLIACNYVWEAAEVDF